jgi:hypothetical protein
MPGGKLRLGRPGTAVLGCMCFALALAAPAGAYIRDFEDRARESARNSLTQKLMSTACPPGKQAFGRGAGIIGGLDRNTAIQRLGPAIGATEPFQNDPNPWVLTAQSLCGSVTSTPPTMATRNTYLKDVEYRYGVANPDTKSPKELVAGCPPGKTPIGGGFHVAPEKGIIVRRAWEEDLRGWVVRAHDARAPGSWGLYTTAICANTTGPPQTRPHDPLPRYVGTHTTVVNSTPQNSLATSERGARLGNLRSAAGLRSGPPAVANRPRE